MTRRLASIIASVLILTAAFAAALNSARIAHATEVSSLTDIEGHDNFDAITYLFEHTIISGYPDGTFKPDTEINRAELTKILAKSKGVAPELTEFNNCFPDVQDEWFAPYVCYAKKQKWIQGYPDGTFKPAQNITKVEAMKMMINSQGISIPGIVNELVFDDVDNNAWYAPYIKSAKDMGLLEQVNGVYGVGEAIKRGEVSENLYRLLVFIASGGSSSGTIDQSQETTETQATNENFSLFTSESFKFSIEYPESWYYGAVETTDANIIRRYEFGSMPIEEQAGEVALELRSGEAPDGINIDISGRTVIKVTEDVTTKIYYEGGKRLYLLTGPSTEEATLLLMAGSIKELE